MCGLGLIGPIYKLEQVCFVLALNGSDQEGLNTPEPVRLKKKPYHVTGRERESIRGLS